MTLRKAGLCRPFLLIKGIINHYELIRNQQNGGFKHIRWKCVKQSVRYCRNGCAGKILRMLFPYLPRIL
jgi:hypothetical protein